MKHSGDSPPIRRYERACIPPLWARGGHAQTLLAHLLPSTGGGDRAPAEGRIVELPDGDRLVVFETPGASGVRVHLFHGLSGDVDADYMRRTLAVLKTAGHEIWAVNHRGCGAGRGLATRPYHSGRTEDMQAVLAASRAEAPDRRHLVVGFSLSGNMALLYAAERREPRIDGIVAVSPPVDLARTSVDIGRGLSRLYELRFLWRLRRAVKRRERADPSLARYEIPLGASLVEFDDLFTAPECGFASGADYYAKCSAVRRLDEIETPSVIVTAADDPFVDPGVYADAALSDHVLLHVEPRGGHVGYLSRGRGGLGWSRWLDGAVAHYVDELAALDEDLTRPRAPRAPR